MADIKLRPMDSYRHMYTSKAFYYDQIAVVTRHLFFTGQHGEISALYRKSNGLDSTTLIRILALHLSR